MSLSGVHSLNPRRQARHPRNRGPEGRGHPAVVIDGAAAHDLEVLREQSALGLRVVEGVGEADAVDRVLRDAVDLARRRDADDLVDGRDDVVDSDGTAARGVASGLIFAGQRTAIGLRVPPKCEASSLVPL